MLASVVATQNSNDYLPVVKSLLKSIKGFSPVELARLFSSNESTPTSSGSNKAVRAVKRSRARTSTPPVSDSTSSNDVTPSEHVSKSPPGCETSSTPETRPSTPTPSETIVLSESDESSEIELIQKMTAFDTCVEECSVYSLTPPDSGSNSPMPLDTSPLDTTSEPMPSESTPSGSLEIETSGSPLIYTPPMSPTPSSSGSNTPPISPESKTSSEVKTPSEPLPYAFYMGVVNAPAAGCRVIRRQLEGEAFEIVVDLEAKPIQKKQKTFSPEEKKKQVDLVDEWKKKILASMNN
ncbi:Protein CBG12793 [Caenorhabditis briggsae]|uniref:Uncharacterized protein n=2 Tax=Caenorhabditis briggsae TaxID=6238 RepID=A0AAE9IZL9_CAEBR|nr:Protein CBG12793 [Caenorhabditis briggsae]ULU13058.1 hypothetical protein L3Y34_015922 [Caenorhabditis briggsae]CAP31715.1 Protein CBG12793 [Caenorhabditis briggsae]